MSDNKIVKLPTDPTNHEWCSVCGDDNVMIVFDGGPDCTYCGEEIVLCSKCYYRMVREVEAIT